MGISRSVAGSLRRCVGGGRSDESDGRRSAVADPMRRWWVVTPEYGVVIPVTSEGQGPVEWGADVIEIEAETGQDAISLGVREMLKGRLGGHGPEMRYRWCLDTQSDGCSPYAG